MSTKKELDQTNMAMKQTMIQLIDLPDELLLMIFKKLNNVELLYSLMDVHRQLDRIVSDSIFTQCLTLLRYSSENDIGSLLDPVLDRFCSQILPKIRDKVNVLHLERSSLERILAVDYPNLHSLVLYNIDKKTAERVFIGNSSMLNISNKQIQSLSITIDKNDGNQREKHELITSIFIAILNVFKCLEYLNYNSLIESNNQFLRFDEKTPEFFSSTLKVLKIKLIYFDACFYLLDGRLPQLCEFYVTACYVSTLSRVINQKEPPLPNMKCFSLECERETHDYKKILVPFFLRISNLEILSLSICVVQQTLLDGNCLKMDIIKHLPKLDQFHFNIRSIIYTHNDPIDVPSNEYIQDTLKHIGKDQVISYVDIFPDNNIVQGHFYSYPYTLTYYENITNNFLGGLFECVREVSLLDERPFEHEFFIRISQSFPRLQKLTVSNEIAQQINNNKQYLPIIEYPQLNRLDLSIVNDNYLEQFLIDRYTCFSDNMFFQACYDSLERVTQNFRRDATRINCAKIKWLCIDKTFNISKRVRKYFPNAKFLKWHNFL